MLTRTWIDRNLTRAQRGTLIDWLMERSSAPTGELIREALLEVAGVPEDELPSLQACLTWRNKVWKLELHKRELREETEAARILADAGGHAIGRANAAMLDAYIFQQLRLLKEGGEVDAEALHEFILSAARATKAVQSARKSDAEIDILERKVAELEAQAATAAAAIEKGKEGGGLTPEQLADLERDLKIK